MTGRIQRTVFGEVAETYDEVRARYPNEIIEEVVALTSLAPRSKVLDVGCGTGILAASFIDRGHLVLGIEPSAAMAKIARRKFAGNLDFRLHLVDFQQWSPGQERFDLVVAGQSWHWMDPLTRFSSAAAALRGGGHLALLWNMPVRQAGALQDALDTAYLTHAPDLHAGAPGAKAGLGGAYPGDEISDDPNFDLVGELDAPWSRTYDASTWASLMSTQSNHRLLDPVVHEALMSDITEAIVDIGGGEITVEYSCRGYVARATRS